MGHSARINIKGQYFGILKVLFYYDTKKKHARWLCECACGNFKVISGYLLRRGDKKSCGCAKKIRSVTSPFKGTWGNICEHCGKEHVRTPDLSRFCSKECRINYADKYSNIEQINK